MNLLFQFFLSLISQFFNECLLCIRNLLDEKEDSNKNTYCYLPFNSVHKTQGLLLTLMVLMYSYKIYLWNTELGKEKSCKFGSFSLLQADFQIPAKSIFLCYQFPHWSFKYCWYIYKCYGFLKNCLICKHALEHPESIKLLTISL